MAAGTSERFEPLYVALLGRFQVRVGRRAIPDDGWRLRKARSLVKLLALAAEHRLHRDQVLEALWPDAAPEAATNSLHRTLHAARRVLEPTLAPTAPSAYLRLQGDTVILTAHRGLQIDVEAFEAAAAAARRTRDRAAYTAALALYHGDLLPEDHYQDWTLGRRETLRALYLALLLDLARVHEDLRDAAAAIAALQRVVESDPVHEEAHAGLMRLHARLGQRYQALRQYQRLKDALAQDLDVEPAGSTQRLYRAIVAGRDPAEQPGPPHLPAPHASPRAPRPGEANSTGAPLSERPTNLPGALSGFIGREQELVAVQRLLATARLLTLTGAGGCGKTRLALRAAAGARDADAYPDGVWLADLAPLEDSRLVPQVVATALRVREEAGRAPVDMLVEALRPRRLLLILDNCEHLATACAELAETLLAACPHLRILVTGRRPLAATGETVWRVPSLSTPDPARLPPFEDLPHYDAVQFFLARAQASRPGFILTPRNAVAVVQICHRLDGIPLAIELAAAWVHVLAVDGIAARLDDVFDLLVGRSEATLPRHHTLRATMDWSHDLLDALERLAYRRLSVFAGGWTLEAAEGICADEGLERRRVLHLIARLVDKSLVVADDHATTVRYRLLETIRQYGTEKLAAAAEEDPMRRRHAAWYLALAERAEPELTGPDPAPWLDRLATEHDNLRAALRWALERGETEVGVRLGATLWRFWSARGHLGEGRYWLERILATNPSLPPALRTMWAHVLNGAGALAYLQGDYARGATLYEESLALRRALGDRRGSAASLNNLGMIAQYQGAYERASTLFEEALAVQRELGDAWGVAASLYNLGMLARDRGAYDRAARMLAESLAGFQQLGDRRHSADLLNSLGYVTLVQGDDARGAALCGEALAMFKDADDRLGINEALQNLAVAARRQGHTEQATALFAEVLALSRDLGDKWGAAHALDGLARLALEQGELEQAETLGRESLALHRALEYKRGIAVSLVTLGDVARGQGDGGRAADLYRESLTLYHDAGDRDGTATGLARLAALVLMHGQPERSARLYGAAEALREGAGVPLPAVERAAHDRAVASLRLVLPDHIMRSAWTAGRSLGPEQAIAEAFVARAAGPVVATHPRDQGDQGNQGDQGDQGDRGAVTLTARESEIVALIARGLTNRQIAGELRIAERTVDTHVGHILKRLGLGSRTAIAAWLSGHDAPGANAGHALPHNGMGSA